MVALFLNWQKSCYLDQKTIPPVFLLSLGRVIIMIIVTAIAIKTRVHVTMSFILKCWLHVQIVSQISVIERNVKRCMKSVKNGQIFIIKQFQMEAHLHIKTDRILIANVRAHKEKREDQKMYYLLILFVFQLTLIFLTPRSITFLLYSALFYLCALCTCDYFIEAETSVETIPIRIDKLLLTPFTYSFIIFLIINLASNVMAVHNTHRIIAKSILFVSYIIITIRISCLWII